MPPISTTRRTIHFGEKDNDQEDATVRHNPGTGRATPARAGRSMSCLFLRALPHHVPLAHACRRALSKAKAEYFERNLRLIDVLIDQDAIKSGAAAAGQPWRYYDLGHGLCTYDFFDTCPHRMACAKCSFYVPKGSSLEQIVEGKANLLCMKQELSLTEEEVAAVDDGLAALDTLQQMLTDVPTPAGPTPRQLQARDQPTAFVSLQTIQKKSLRK